MFEASIRLKHACELSDIVQRRTEFDGSSKRTGECRQRLLTHLGFKNLTETY
jgi:hypothetical protein